MLRCYIIDDEYHSVEILISYIAQTPGLELAGYATNPLTALNDITGVHPPDVTFLDVEMPELSGMEVAGLVKPYTTVIFTTSFREFAVEAFEKEAFDFLPKPISYARFRQSISRIQRDQEKKITSQQREFFFVKSDVRGKMVKVAIKDIIYVEGAQNYIKIHLTTGNMMPYLTINEIEEYLPSTQFARIHQSFIVNNEFVKAVEPGRVILINDHSLNIGRYYKDAYLKKIKGDLLISRRKY
ncbi:LytTR family DNA-binding domain-containing protein [Mucilaginibacter sp. CSA2-8R]|uniref:LytR/AlgR family response regulator transcription factor n=1 Tax=Mucilaginibacter sp. CSA2-8R TaxID=3141542 RepID=UPI00315D70D1